MREFFRNVSLMIQAVFCVCIMCIAQKYLEDDYDIMADDYERAMYGAKV